MREKREALSEKFMENLVVSFTIGRDSCINTRYFSERLTLRHSPVVQVDFIGRDRARTRRATRKACERNTNKIMSNHLECICLVSMLRFAVLSYWIHIANHSQIYTHTYARIHRATPCECMELRADEKRDIDNYTIITKNSICVVSSYELK